MIGLSGGDCKHSQITSRKKALCHRASFASAEPSLQTAGAYEFPVILVVRRIDATDLSFVFVDKPANESAMPFRVRRNGEIEDDQQPPGPNSAAHSLPYGLAQRRVHLVQRETYHSRVECGSEQHLGCVAEHETGTTMFRLCAIE